MLEPIEITEKEIACYHCTAPLPTAPVYGTIKGRDLGFCCQGCLSVAEYIHEAGLESYYETRAPKGAALPTFPEKEAEGLEARFARGEGDSREAYLLIEGIHCAACVWLIEKAVSRVPGVVEAGVNFSTHRMHVRWINKAASLGEIIKKIRAVGYLATEYDGAAETPLVKARNDTLLKMSVAGFSAATTIFLADGLYGGYIWGIDVSFRNYLQWVSLFAAIPAVFYSGSAFIAPAWNGLRNRALTMDLTIALGALLTFFYSVWATVNKRGDVYFDTAAMFVFLILAGRFLEASYRRKAWSDTERLNGLETLSATVIREGVRETVAVRSVNAGDMVEIKPGERVPLDGVVEEGDSSVDESMLTGEARPVHKSYGSTVYGSTVNTDGTLRVRVTATGADTVLSRIKGLVERAQTEKARVQVLSDRIAGYFVPFILVAALATYLAWSYFDPPRAVISAVAVLIITCPCALALATPAAVIIGCGAAAKDGIVVRSGAALERLHKATHVVFDKTGTLTEGRMRLTGFIPAAADFSEERLLMTAALVEQFSEHPIGKAIAAEAQKRGARLTGKTEAFRAYPGKGVEGVVRTSGEAAGAASNVVAFAPLREKRDDRWTVIAGSREFMAERGVAVPAGLLDRVLEMNSEGNTAVFVASSKSTKHLVLLGVITLSDALRPGADELVGGLKSMGLKVTMLSGDNERTAKAVARKTGIENVISGVLPEGKEEAVKRLKSAGDVVVMVGDGINDGPALAASDIGVAVGSATQLAIGSSDIVLLNSDPMTVMRAVEVSRNTFGAIRGNLMLSFVYNMIVLPLAAFGIVTPVVAAIAMPLSSLAVIGNSVRAARRGSK